MLKNRKYLYGGKSVLIPFRVHFGEYILKKLWLHTDKIALINGATNETTTFRQIAQQAMNLAVSLIRLGVRKGDMVAVISENRKECFITVIGVAFIGAINTTVNPFYTKEEISHAIKISKPKYLICSETVYNTHLETFQSTECIERIIMYGNEKIDDCVLFNELVTPIDGNETELNDAKINDDKLNGVIKRLVSDVSYDDFDVIDVVGQTDLVFLLYSSGTTGLSKGVALTHHNVVSLCCSEPTDFCDGPVLVVGPWFHAMCLMLTLLGFSSGRTIAFLPKFEINLYLKTIETHRVTMLIAAPAILVAVLKNTAHYDLSSVRRIISGSAPLHPDVITDILPRFPNAVGIMMGYGMTETTVAITYNKFDDHKMLNKASVGRVLPNMVVKIVDSNRNPLGPYEQGEICVKGDFVMKGYIGADNAAARDDEDFFMTGDIGYYDADHYLYLVGRKKELIKYKGYQVPPAEIEALLLQHEAIKEAGVIGLPDKEAGEVPLAFVSLQQGKSATEKEIQDYVSERISKIKQLRGGVRFVPEIPKNTTGKILRSELRKLIDAGPIYS